MNFKKQIFVNLPVSDLSRSMRFFERLGFSSNARFTDDNAACMIISDDIYAMLITRAYFSTFTSRPIADTMAATGVILALSVPARADVDSTFDRAIAEGGTPNGEAIDYGWMYTRSFYDPDGHLWETLWMNPDAPENQG